MLGWTEFDPASVFGADVFYVGRVETVGDGRVLVQVASPEGNQVMVSENGADWTVIPMPPDFSLEHFDIAGDRWLVAGWAAIEMAESTGRALFSDDQGTTWDRPEHPARSRRWGRDSIGGCGACSGREHGGGGSLAAHTPTSPRVIVARGLVPRQGSRSGDG